ncbi:winged helix-turn-helix transcriptional regulator, partial [Rhizobium sp. SEMIA 4085]|uniref:Lrp/AsnC family transcriptional regulator n=1 Tax=Rhizobium sp. SEMIA 4085 TaxID=2137761 RepID=UPI001FEF636E
MDETDARILAALDSDARLSMSELARLIGMSAPSMSERVRRLENAGVIRGFTLGGATRANGDQLRAMGGERPLRGKPTLGGKLVQERPGVGGCGQER